MLNIPTTDLGDITRRFHGLVMSTDYCWDTVHIVRFLDSRGVEGDIVECGVYRGGQVMLAMEVAEIHRRYWLYDTFEGSPIPGPYDQSSRGANGVAKWHDRQRIDGGWCVCSLDEVRNNFERFGMLDDRINFVKGKVEDTLRTGPLPEQIAFLRLDTNFYESTKIELEVLWPLLVLGGVLVIDDYYMWNGARKATNGYLADKQYSSARVDSGSYVVVKQC